MYLQVVTSYNIIRDLLQEGLQRLDVFQQRCSDILDVVQDVILHVTHEAHVQVREPRTVDEFCDGAENAQQDALDSICREGGDLSDQVFDRLSVAFGQAAGQWRVKLKMKFWLCRDL